MRSPTFWCAKILLRHGSGMYCQSSPRRGTGWTSESTHRTAMRSAAGVRSLVVIVEVIAVFSRSKPLLSLCADTCADVYPVELRGIAPAQLVALLGGECARHLQLVGLPVRVAGPVHHHVFLAGEAEPLAREVGVAGPVHRTLHEVDVPRQVVARHLRRPRRLLEVRTAEAVHPPHERSQQVGRTVGPDELQAGHPFEY